MLAALHTFLSSPNAITAACIGSWGITSTSVEDIIHRPIQSVFWPLVCGGVAGKWITTYTPPEFGPYVAAIIISVTVAGLLARRLRFGPKPADKHWSLNILEAIDNHYVKERFSYTAHNMFENKGIVLETENTLTSEVVKAVLIESLDRLDGNVVAHINKITEWLKKAELLHKMSGIFIHDNRKGYVMINGPNKESKHILSIMITS